VGSIVYMIHFIKIISFHSVIHSSWEHFNPQMTSSHRLWVHKSTREAWFFFTNIFHKNLWWTNWQCCPSAKSFKTHSEQH